MHQTIIVAYDSLSNCCRVLFLQCILFTSCLRLLWRNDTFFLKVIGLTNLEYDDINHTSESNYVESVTESVLLNHNDLCSGVHCNNLRELNAKLDEQRHSLRSQSKANGHA